MPNSANDKVSKSNNVPVLNKLPLFLNFRKIILNLMAPCTSYCLVWIGPESL